MLTVNVDFNGFFTFSFLTFFLPVTFLFWTSVEAQSLVIGSLQPIIVAPGDDVILPCHLEPRLNVESLTVEWSKPDLKPDPSDRLSRVGYVHLYRDRREVVDMKIESYVGRTELLKDDLKNGNISLRIVNVTPADSGRYRCFIPKLRSKKRDSIVELVVDPNYSQTWTTEMPLQTPDPKEEVNMDTGWSSRSHLIPILVLPFGLVIVAFVGFGVCLINHNHQKDELLEKC